MSVATWEKLYYPISAAEAAKQGDLAATRHCVRKWEGLSSEIRAEHGLKVESKWEDFGYLTDNQETGHIFIDITTCALCTRHHWTCEEDTDCCPNCPIVKAIGRPCFVEYDTFCHTGDAEPMRATLNATLEWLLAQEEKKENA